MECKRCDVGWKLLEGDHFCGFCGHPAHSISVRFSPQTLYAGPFQGKLTLHLTNDGSFPVHLLEISLPNMWKADVPFAKGKILPGEQHSFEVKPAQPLEVQPNGKICIQIQEITEVITTELPVFPLPQLTFQGEPLRVGLLEKKAEDRKEEEEIVATPRWKLENAPLRLFEVRSLDRWWSPTQHVPAEGRFLPVGELLSLSISLHPNFLQREGRVEGRVHLGLLSPEQGLSVEATFPLLIQAKPQLRFSELPPPGYLYHCPSHLEESPTLHLHIQARGEKGFAIQRMEASASDGKPAFQHHCSFPLSSKKVSPAKSKEELLWEVSIPFYLSRQQRRSADTYDLTFALSSEPYGLLKTTLHVVLESPQELLVAVDFGTSSTCVASISLNQTNSQREVLFHRYQNVDDELLPTLLFYKGLKENSDPLNPLFLYEIGTSAKTHQQLAYKKVEFYNLIQSVKRNLGTNKHTYLSFSGIDKIYSLLPKVLVRDYLESLLNDVSKKGQIRSLYITHPTRFSELQIQELRETILALGYPQAHLLDEASATAFYYVESKKIESNQTGRPIEDFFSSSQFHLIVYDFGGGTTDITISHVCLPLDDDSSHISMKTLAAGGIKDLGGEDVTEQIIQKILLPNIRKKIVTQLNKQLRYAETIDIPYKQPTERHLLSEDTHLLMQSITLYEIAEKIKTELSEKSSYQSPHRSFSFSYKDQSGTLQRSAELDWEISINREELNEILKDLFQRGICYLKEIVQGHRLSLDSNDLLLLAGQSSRIPLLQEMMKKAFFPCQVELLSNANLKRCVALGACYYGDQHSNANDRDMIKLEGFSNVTRFSYAIVRRHPLRGSTLQEQIPQFSPLGQMYPIQPLSVGTRIELYQNATPWIKDPNKADADLIGLLYADEKLFLEIDPRSCLWFIAVDSFERISLVIQKKEGDQLLWEERFPCKPIAF